MDALPVVCCLDAGAHSAFILQLGHVGMPGIELAFLTPDADNRSCRKLLLLKRRLSDMGSSYDIGAALNYFVSQIHSSRLLYTGQCCH